MQDAARFSLANHQLHSVWRNCISDILEPQIPAFEDAVAFDKLETQFSSTTDAEVHLDLGDTDTASEPDSVSSQPRKNIPRLMRNAKLASSACAAWNKCLKELPSNNYRLKIAYTSFPKSYYLIRQVVLAFHHHELWDDVHSKLQASSTDELRTHSEFCRFMCRMMDEDEQARQGILKAEEDWTWEDELAVGVTEPWEFASEMITKAVQKRLDVEREAREAEQRAHKTTLKRSISAIS